MPYVIAIVVLIIGAAAFALFNMNTAPDETQPNAPTEINRETEQLPEESANEAAETQSLPTEVLDEDDPAVSGVNEDVPVAEQPDVTEFADGTYTVQTSYFTPRRTEHVMDITITLENDIITATEIVWDGDVDPKTPSHTGFENAYEAEVIGQPISEVFLSRTGGASLTSASFNEALKEVEAQASNS